MRMWAMLVAGLAAACTGSGATGATVSRNLNIGSAFDQIAVNGPDDVRVVPGPGIKVIASGPSDELDRLEVFVEGRTLKVRRKRDSWGGVFGGGNQGVVVTVTAPNIRGASLAGSGDLTIDRARSDTFGASVAGSGNLEVRALEATKVATSIAGSGDVKLAGSARDVRISIAGSGNADTSALRSGTAVVAITGSGDARIRASQAATVSITGSGNVDVIGTEQCKVSKMGSGDVRCVRG